MPGTTFAKAAIAPSDDETYARLRRFFGRSGSEAHADVATKV